ncbi:hypothetical protein OGAPHI_000977 [Ogataea philodendri]|uniref:Uncharacterized protein n=1 Tax=Ogataea philodendri TaxID=1378263 RepID=A0A9P8PEM9_9ASCO|nr:uncharacterized protein OGAPHI_000977 [Ogataea philodendri]KAH3670462.1 hypothetical protein OGAPHI_000977 [Ogataea philodendri]
MILVYPVTSLTRLDAIVTLFFNSLAFLLSRSLNDFEYSSVALALSALNLDNSAFRFLKFSLSMIEFTYSFKGDPLFPGFLDSICLINFDVCSLIRSAICSFDVCGSGLLANARTETKNLGGGTLLTINMADKK